MQRAVVVSRGIRGVGGGGWETWSMGVSVLSVTNVLNKKVEEVLKYACKYTLTDKQRIRVIAVMAMLILVYC